MYELDIFVLLINLPILFFYKLITKKLNLYDLSDGSKKISRKTCTFGRWGSINI